MFAPIDVWKLQVFLGVELRKTCVGRNECLLSSQINLWPAWETQSPVASSSSLPNKGLDSSALKSKREALIDIKGLWIRPEEGQSQPGTSRNNSMWCTWSTATNQRLRFQALNTANSELANNSWKCAKKIQRKICKETAMCLWVFCEQKNMLYLWNKLVPEKCSLSLELCAVKSANQTKLLFSCQRKWVSTETWMKRAFKMWVANYISFQ